MFQTRVGRSFTICCLHNGLEAWVKCFPTCKTFRASLVHGPKLKTPFSIYPYGSNVGFSILFLML